MEGLRISQTRYNLLKIWWLVSEDQDLPSEDRSWYVGFWHLYGFINAKLFYFSLIFYNKRSLRTEMSLLPLESI